MGSNGSFWVSCFYFSTYIEQGFLLGVLSEIHIFLAKHVEPPAKQTPPFLPSNELGKILILPTHP